jgi:hypothetical protein
MRLILSAAMLPVLLTGFAASAAVTEDECVASRDRLLEEIRQNRIYTEAHYQENLDAAEDDFERRQWQVHIDRAYDNEESQRAIADQIWRDCMAATEQ